MGNFTVLAVQARTFDAEEEAKDSFYDDLKAAIDSAHNGKQADC